MFSLERKTEICRQIYISQIFDEFHNQKLYSRKRLITNYKQALAMALSISESKCVNLNNLKRNFLNDMKVEDLLRLIKSKELKLMVKYEKNFKKEDIKEPITKKEIYSKFFNKQKFINKLIYYLKK